jgi:hypothetical protein
MFSWNSDATGAFGLQGRAAVELSLMPNNQQQPPAEPRTAQPGRENPDKGRPDMDRPEQDQERIERDDGDKRRDQERPQ